MSLQSNDRRYRLGFIGGGKLAGSVMRGLVRAKFCAPTEIFLSEPHEVARTALREELGIFVTAENAEVAERAEVVLIGVKPRRSTWCRNRWATRGKLVASLGRGEAWRDREKGRRGSCER
jgi:pyrroline-5-carboxylate reductase